MEKFKDRHEAGLKLASLLSKHANSIDTVILALPRGGVPVGFEVAKRLKLPLKVFIVKKLGVPSQEELAFGAISSLGTYVLNEDVMTLTNLSPDEIESIKAKKIKEINDLEASLNVDTHIDIEGKTVILIDDGIATGATVKAAILSIKTLKPKKIVLAAPVSSPITFSELSNLVDEAYSFIKPVNMQAIGLFYEDFSQTSVEEVNMLLKEAKKYEL